MIKLEIELQDDFVKILKMLVVIKLGSSTNNIREEFWKDSIEELIVELAEEEVFNRIKGFPELFPTIQRYYGDVFESSEQKEE